MEEQQYSIVQQMLQGAQQTTQESFTEAQGVHGGYDSKPRPRFNPAEDVDALVKALSAKEVDKGSIIDILTKRTNEQRQELKAAYQKQTGKTLEEDLKKALGGKAETAVLDMLKPPALFDAHHLKSATKGLGTDEDAINEILLTRSNQQINRMKEAYKTEFKNDVETDIIGDTSGEYQKALLALLKGERSEDCYVNQDLAEKDAKALFEAGENRKKADVPVFSDIFCHRSYPHLGQVFKNYAKHSKHDLNKALDLELKGDLEKCLVDTAKVAVSKPAYFAEKLHSAMKGLGTRDKVLSRVMVSQQEGDMKGIKNIFKEKYGKSLRETIMGDTSGDFQTVLVGLCGHDD